VRPFYDFLDWLVPFIAGKWFHLHAGVAFPMFDKVDDSNYGLAFLYLNLIVSIVVTVVWSVWDRRKSNYEKLYQWLRLYLGISLLLICLGMVL
jgi:hypothetical protein